MRPAQVAENKPTNKLGLPEIMPFKKGVLGANPEE
jgi:hypothetical protein